MVVHLCCTHTHTHTHTQIHTFKYTQTSCPSSSSLSLLFSSFLSLPSCHTLSPHLFFFFSSLCSSSASSFYPSFTLSHNPPLSVPGFSQCGGLSRSVLTAELHADREETLFLLCVGFHTNTHSVFVAQRSLLSAEDPTDWISRPRSVVLFGSTSVRTRVVMCRIRPNGTGYSLWGVISTNRVTSVTLPDLTLDPWTADLLTHSDLCGHSW